MLVELCMFCMLVELLVDIVDDLSKFEKMSVFCVCCKNVCSKNSCHVVSKMLYGCFTWHLCPEDREKRNVAQMVLS